MYLYQCAARIAYTIQNIEYHLAHGSQVCMAQHPKEVFITLSIVEGVFLAAKRVARPAASKGGQLQAGSASWELSISISISIFSTNQDRSLSSSSSSSLSSSLPSPPSQLYIHPRCSSASQLGTTTTCPPRELIERAPSSLLLQGRPS